MKYQKHLNYDDWITRNRNGLYIILYKKKKNGIG